MRGKASPQCPGHSKTGTESCAPGSQCGRGQGRGRGEGGEKPGPVTRGPWAKSWPILHMLGAGPFPTERPLPLPRCGSAAEPGAATRTPTWGQDLPQRLPRLAPVPEPDQLPPQLPLMAGRHGPYRGHRGQVKGIK